MILRYNMLNRSVIRLRIIQGRVVPIDCKIVGKDVATPVHFISRRSSSSFPYEIMVNAHSRVLQATTRDPLGGSRRSAKLREAGMVPGLLYGKGMHGDDSKVMLAVPQQTIQTELRYMQQCFQNVPYLLALDGADPADAELVFPILEGRDPQSMKAITVNWIRYGLGRKLRIPLRFINDELSEAIRRGAWVQQQERSIEIVINSMDPASIPKWIDVDLSGVTTGESITTKHLKLKEGVQIFKPEKPFRNGIFIGSIKGKRLQSDEELEGVKEEEEPGEEEK